jgi:hypothetical protein
MTTNLLFPQTYDSNTKSSVDNTNVAEYFDLLDPNSYG